MRRFTNAMNARSVRGVCAAAIVAVAAAVPGSPSPSYAQTSESLCTLQTAERVVAVGDVHGAYDQFVGILREAGLVDRRDRWIGGRSWLVQTGDVLDRGPHSRRVIDLLRRLERDAARAGGRVFALLGNHELMRVIGDWRYVSSGELKAFERADSLELRDVVYKRIAESAAARAQAEKRVHDEAAFREQFLKEVPLGFIEMRVAFDAMGDYGQWVRSRPTMVVINGIAFLHGGISDMAAPLGCEGINAAVTKELAALPPPEQVPSMLAAGETGPLWYRGLANEPEEAFAPMLASILERMKVRAFVIGHTPVLPGRIATRFGGRVIQIDAGMLDGEFFPKGVPTALEIRGSTFTTIAAGRRDPVSTPALTPAPQASAPSASK